MRRELRTLLAMALFALPVGMAAAPGVARAGITTDLKTAGRPADVYQIQTTVIRTALAADGSGTSTGSSETEDGAPVRPGHRGGDPWNFLGPQELAQVEAGLITPEEATSGCGAQVAGGDALLAPLALVGLFLALRRRR